MGNVKCAIVPFIYILIRLYIYVYHIVFMTTLGVTALAYMLGDLLTFLCRGQT